MRRHNADGRCSSATKVYSKDLRGARQLRKSLNLEIRLVALFFIPEPCPQFCSQELNILLGGSVGLCH